MKETMITARGDAATLLRGYSLSLTVEGLKPNTIDHYVRDARRFCDFGDVRKATPATLTEFLAAYRDGKTAKTVREMQTALRKFCRWLVTEGEAKSDPTAGMKLTRFRVEPQPTYSEVEIKRLLLACDSRTPDGIRDRAIILTLWDTGVRVSELLSMTVPDFERGSTVVNGKTGVRSIPLSSTALQALERYLRKWRIADAPIWRGRRGPLARSGVYQIIAELCGRAGIAVKGPHCFRRGAAAAMKRAGMQDSDILQVCGWSNITMLRRYTAEVAGELAALAHERYSPADRLAR